MQKMRKHAFIVAVIITVQFLFNAQAFASLATGIDITAGKFKLHITMTPTGEEYSDEGLLYFRNPSGLLFDLIALFQEHYNELSTVEKYYWVDLSPEISEIIVDDQLKKEKEGGSIRISRYKKLTIKLLRNEICSLLPIKGCSLGGYEKTYFYRSTITNQLELPDSIFFGSIPSDLSSKNYVLRTPKENDKKFEKIQITKKRIGSYFDKLELW